MNLMALAIATTITVVNPLNVKTNVQPTNTLVFTQVSEGRYLVEEVKEINIDTTITHTTLPTKTMYATDLLSVRNEPSTEGKIIHVLNKNDEIQVIYEMEDWSVVQYGVDVLYVKSEYLSDTKSYSDEDYEMLAHLIFSETGSDWIDITCLYYTGSVVLNRVASEDYPNTIKEVIEQYGQYECAPYYMDKTPTERCYQLAHDLLTFGSRLPENVIYQSQFKQGSKVYSYLDGTYYCCR